MRLLSAALMVGASALVACGAHRNTERVFDGHTVVGPYIEPEAYAAYAEGVYREEHGDVDGALHAYRRARASDADSPAISVRIAALSCRSDLDAALAELDTSGAGRDYAPAWVERGRCLRHHGRPDEALAAARRGVMLDGDSPDATLLVAQLLREQRAPEAASAWLFAWLLTDRDPARRGAIAAEARALGDPALARASQTTTRDSGDMPGAEAPLSPPLERARRESARDPALALAEARRVLSANPGNGDALVIALFAAHRLGDERSLADLLLAAHPTSLPASELAPLLLELIRYRTGEAAAEAWAEAYRMRASQTR